MSEINPHSPFSAAFSAAWKLDAKIGPVARPCAVEWVRYIVAQCADYGLPCFVKQLGARPTRRMGVMAEVELQSFAGRHPGTPEPMSLRDSKGGDPDEWPEDVRVREFPEGMR